MRIFSSGCVVRQLALAASLSAAVSGCSGSEGIPIQPGGGSSNGGNAPVGGTSAGTGAMAATGGSAVATATGGRPGFGGTTSVFATGGKTNAGTTNTGGGVATGGSASSGGAATGGKAANTGGVTNTATGGTTNSAATGGKAANAGGTTNTATGGTTNSAATGGKAANAGGTTNGAATGGKSSSGGTSSGATGGTTNAVATGGKSNTGGAATGGIANNGGSTGGLPRLTVNGTKLQDPNGKTIILRGSSLIDIGAIYAYGGQNNAAFTSKLSKIAAAGVQGHVVRLPAYPKICYNGGSPYCPPVPYPVGTGPSTSCSPTAPLSASDYYTKVLKPAVDAATALNLYVIIDYHQIDNATTGTSAADATTFWTDIAPRFKDYANVFYEPFNEPIDNTKAWSALKPVVQGWITTIRAAAPDNVIIVPSNSWDQKPGDAASDPPSGGNLMYTAHIYTSNWNTTFQNQVTTGVGKAPVFVTEWGYTSSDPSSWGTSLQTFIDNAGASWTAWVTDNSWSPPMFTDTGLTQLTSFGSLVKSWLAAKANSDWVQ
jgi:endoglucanase